jgi:hypothetical protein
MSYINKYINFKFWLIVFLISWIVLYLNNDANAKYMKKLSIEPFAEPKNWNNSFKPGVVLGQMIENSLANINAFEMIPFQENNLINKNPNIASNSIDIDGDKLAELTIPADSNNSQKEIISTKSSLSQIQIRGGITIFNPDVDVLIEGHSKNKSGFYKERALITASIQVVNMHTDRIIVEKKITSISNDGNLVFNSKLSNYNYESDEFKSTSIGKALWILNDLIKIYILKSLEIIPLEGDLIFANHEKKNALINIGKTNGVMVQDVFTVFSMKAKFNDPVDKVDLGDMYTRKGVIIISEVQGRFSRAKILAGQDFIAGDFVIPKNNR